MPFLCNVVGYRACALSENVDRVHARRRVVERLAARRFAAAEQRGYDRGRLFALCIVAVLGGAGARDDRLRL